MATTLDIITKVDVSQAEQANEELIEGANEAESSYEGVTDQIDKMTGGAITAFKSIVAGAKSGTAAMFTLKGAIAATGIGALVIAVGSLVTYFTQTQRGADLLNQAFETIGATVDVLVDRFSKVGEAFVTLFTNPTEALNLFKEAVSGIGEEIVKEAAVAKQLEKDYQALEKRRIDFIVTEQKLRAEIEAARLISEKNDEFNAQQRFAANQKAIKLEKQLADEKEAQAKEDLRIAIARNKQGESRNEDLEKAAQLEAEVFRIGKDRDTRLKELVSKQRTLTAELQKQSEIIKGVDELSPIESQGASELSPQGEIELSQQEMLNKKLAETNERYASEQNRLNEEQAKSDLERDMYIQNAKIGLLQTGFKTAYLLSAKNAKDQKNIAAVEATYNTLAAIVGTLRGFSTNPTPGLAIAQAVATGVFGFLQVQKILSTNTPSTSAPSYSSPSFSGSNDSNTSVRIPDFGTVNQGVGDTQNALFRNRAYVVNQDIRNDDALNQRLEELASVD